MILCLTSVMITFFVIDFTRKDQPPQFGVIHKNTK